MAATDTKPAGVFRKEDLWKFVDIGRQNYIEERARKAEAIAEELAKRSEPSKTVKASPKPK